MKQLKVLIIGAGYGGLRAAELLASDKRFSILLIDKNPYHYMQTEVYGYIAGRFDLSDIVIDLESFSRGLGENVRFLQATVTSIDPQKRLIETETESYVYDYAIIATGAQTHFFSFIEGAREHTHGIKDLMRAFTFRQAFEKRIMMRLQNKTLKRAGDLQIAVAGAGLSGVEIAAEMAYTLKKLQKVLSFAHKEITIYLIDAAPTVLPGMDPWLIETSHKRLETLGVKIKTNHAIRKISDRTITFKNDTTLHFDFIIFTAGIKAATLTEKIDAPKNRLSQIIPDPYMRLPGSEHTFIIGDSAQIADKDGTPLPPTAQIAEKSAAYVAKTITQLENREPILPLDTKSDGMFVALGGKYAAGILYNRIKTRGYTAWLLKKAITYVYRHGLDIRVNAGYAKRRCTSANTIWPVTFSDQALASGYSVPHETGVNIRDG